MPPRIQNSNSFYSLEQAAAKLKDFAWNPRFFARTEELEDAYRQYARDLTDAKLGRDLTEQEDAYHWSRWFRSQAMVPNLDPFNLLTDLSFHFVDELIRIRKQSILGTRAGLVKIPIHQRPSRNVEFKPEPIPDEPPLDSFQYETTVGGPHVFGARLLWWCAAAKSPKQFGYGPGFSQELWSQPIWFHDRKAGEKFGLEANQRPITLLQEAVAYCWDNREASETELSPEDGPGPSGTFRWKGKQIKLTPQQANLIGCLWKRCGKPRQIQSVIDEAWFEKPDTTKNAVETCVCKLNSRFSEAQIPFTISVEDQHVILRRDDE